MVAAFVSDPDNATQWYVNIQSITWETTPPAVVGSRIAFVAQFLGRRITYTYEVQEIAPRERFVMSTAQGPFPMQTTYSWQDTESGGTRMTLRTRTIQWPACACRFRVLAVEEACRLPSGASP